MSKSQFLRIYAQLPENVRKEIIAVVDDRPYTWDSAYIEINDDTELGQKILKKMKETELLEDE